MVDIWNTIFQKKLQQYYSPKFQHKSSSPNTFVSKLRCGLELEYNISPKISTRVLTSIPTQVFLPQHISFNASFWLRVGIQYINQNCNKSTNLNSNTSITPTTHKYQRFVVVESWNKIFQQKVQQ